MDISNLNKRKPSTFIVIGVGALFLVVILFQQIFSGTGSYQSRISQQRADHHLWLQNSPQSPLPKAERANFTTLSYFDIDGAYAVQAEFERLAQPETLNVVNSHDQAEQMVWVGNVYFRLEEKPYSLRAFKVIEGANRAEMKANEVFVPFADETSALTTYGGGRYLNVSTQSPVVIDFNLAYHPYCLYNPEFICPLPPPQNVLPIAIEAGERLPQAEPSSSPG